MVAQNKLRTYEIKKVFAKKKRFYDSFYVTKCLQQIEIPDILHICTPCSELPFYIGTMTIFQYIPKTSPNMVLS